MKTYSSFAIVVSFFGLWISLYLSELAQVCIGFILILSFGILHGANDLELIQNVNEKPKTLYFYKLLFYYVVIVIIGAFLFYFIPWLALTFFILVSGYHFGEQQWNKQLTIKNESLNFVFYMIYGLIILFLIFSNHATEVQKIIQSITAIKVPIFLFLLVLKILFLLFSIFSVVLYFKCDTFKKYIFKEVFYLGVFTILFKISSLIWGFALYFIVWHSIPSILDQMKFLFGKVSFSNFKLYFRSAFVYWIVSLVGIGILYIYFKDQKIFNALFFSFLASITFPHVMVIFKICDRNN